MSGHTWRVLLSSPSLVHAIPALLILLRQNSIVRKIPQNRNDGDVVGPQKGVLPKHPMNRRNPDDRRKLDRPYLSEFAEQIRAKGPYINPGKLSISGQAIFDPFIHDSDK